MSQEIKSIWGTEAYRYTFYEPYISVVPNHVRGILQIQTQKALKYGAVKRNPKNRKRE